MLINWADLMLAVQLFVAGEVAVELLQEGPPAFLRVSSSFDQDGMLSDKQNGSCGIEFAREGNSKVLVSFQDKFDQYSG